MSTKTIRSLLIALVLGAAASLLGACSTARYGDGKAGPIPLDPLVEKVAAAADAKVPGAGDKVKAYFAGAKAERVPTGYRIRYETLLDGQPIDVARITKRPVLEPIIAGSIVTPDELPDPAAVPADLVEILKGAGL